MEYSANRYADSQPLKTRAKEGLALELHISFQYHVYICYCNYLF